MRRTTIAAAALLAASSLALAPAAHADTTTGPGGKIQVTAAGTSVGSLFGDLSVHPGAHGSREVTMVNASADTAILIVRAVVPKISDRNLGNGLSLCWLGGEQTFGQLSGDNTVIGTALLAPGESTKASFGYRFSETAAQPAAGASTGFTLNFNLRQAMPREKPGVVKGNGAGCGSTDDWKTAPVSNPSPKPDPGKPGNPNPGKPDDKPGNPNPGKPAPGDKPGKPAPGDKPGKPDDKPGNPNPGKPAPGDKPGKPAPGDKPGDPNPGKPGDKPPTAGGPEVVLPGDPSPTAVPTDQPKPPAPGDPGGPEGPGDPKPSVDGKPGSGQGSKPDAGTAPVAGKDDAPDKLVVSGANTLIASALGAGMIGIGAWLVARRRKTA